ncbi:hypothetical protein V6667_07470 [Neisseria leonii]|uniref:hypothetical protein n=1 Tax=Neisseria leonii TaxID=2995413 RepID=UPI00237B08F3|nr:hypothetical protein [Neisseria sp. 3986]MDD9324938.1 hypothetical protein [Neisseria sp. 3986]
MGKRLAALPVWLVLADMVYGLAVNIGQSVAGMPKSVVGTDGLPVSPEIAFSGLQLLANGGMVAVIGFGLVVLLRLNRTVAQGTVMPVGAFSLLGLLAVLAFSLPSLWQWLWAVIRLADGVQTVDWGNWRYLAVALCLPWVGVLCLVRLVGRYRLAKRPPQTASGSF